MAALAVGSWQLAGANEKANKEEPTATTRTPPLQRCETRAIDPNRDTPSNPFVGGRERVGAPLGDVGQVPGGCVKPALRSLRWCASWRQSKQHEPVPLLLVLQVLRYSRYSGTPCTPCTPCTSPMPMTRRAVLSGRVFRAILVRTKAYQAAVRLNVVQ